MNPERKIAEWASEVADQAAEMHRTLSKRRDPTHASIGDALDRLIDAARSVRRWASTAATEDEPMVKERMREILAEEKELTATELAELTAEELDMEDEVLDDDTHPIWDWAVEVLEDEEDDEEEE